MKIAKVTDLIRYGNNNSDIRLNREVLYRYYHELRCVNLDKYKYIKLQNLKQTQKNHKDDEELQNWLIIFKAYIKAKKSKKKQKKEQKKFKKNIENLVAGFRMTRGFVKREMKC